LFCGGSFTGRYEYFLLDSETGEPSRVFEGVKGQGIGLSSDGKLALFQEMKRSELVLTVFDVTKKGEVGRITVPFPEKFFPMVTLSPDGRSVVVFNFGKSVVTVYDVNRAQE
jgi:hypothetical protein